MEPDVHRHLPRHVAIIMDGNGRWAQQRGKPRIWGHKAGSHTVRRITEECSRLGLSQLTLYAFSYENWQRPPGEVEYLMTLLRRFVIKERNILMKNDIRLLTIGRTDLLPLNVRKELERSQNMTGANQGMKLCLALSYGGRQEIVDCTKKIARQVLANEISIDDIDEGLLSQQLYQPDMPELDLLIRTGGEMRLSNFLLWQISYGELWITPTLWPDFAIEELHHAFDDFSGRERRFGKVPASNLV